MSLGLVSVLTASHVAKHGVVLRLVLIMENVCITALVRSVVAILIIEHGLQSW